MESGRQLHVLIREAPGWFLVCLFAIPLCCGVGWAQTRMTQEQALRLYFPAPLQIERRTVYLTDRQVDSIRQAAQTPVESKMVSYYVGKRDAVVVGYAFFETQIVRTMPATYMIVLLPDGVVRGVEILAFYEPEDYLPPASWLRLYNGRDAHADLRVKREIPNVVGATLSARGVADGVRRVLKTFGTAIPKE